MTIVCQNVNCKYKTPSGFCNKEMVAFNQYGACVHWWTPDGQFRGQILDYAEVPVQEEFARDDAEEKHELPHQENIEASKDEEFCEKNEGNEE